MRSESDNKTSLLKSLGPGLITGAADDDPSGIATYSQAGAQFGTQLLWTTVLTIPLMIGIQMISARIGWVTGRGVAANLQSHFPRPFGFFVVTLLVIANTVNLGADLSTMAAVLELLAGRSLYHVALVGFALLSLALQIWMPFPRYAPLLKLLTLSLFAYVGVVLAVDIPWRHILHDTMLPRFGRDRDYWLTVAAVLGTTISPYLFFWQASQESEQRLQDGGLSPAEQTPNAARRGLRRIRIDTYVGMIFSNAIAFFIMLTTAMTLHAHGIDDVTSTQQAADALRPIAGDAAYLMYALGVIGAGMLAVPVLAGSAAYAVAETLRWPSGLSNKPAQARGFYAVLAGAVLVGVALSFNDVDPVRELFWAAVLNGIIAVPIMIALMLVIRRADIMGTFVARPRLNALGWLATAAMAAVVAGLAWANWFG